MEIGVKTVLEAANRHYPDGFLAEYYDEDGDRRDASGDTLAEFIVIELSQTVPEHGDPESRLSVARGVLVRAKQDLDRAIRGVEELADEFYDEAGAS